MILKFATTARILIPVIVLAGSSMLFSPLASAKVQPEKPVVQVAHTGPDSDVCVVLIHGLARTASSMDNLAALLAAEQFSVVVVDYPSRHYQIDKLSDVVLSAGVKGCEDRGSTRLSIVTHSLGAILVRYYLSQSSINGLERVVMLAPPNKGSAVVDNLKDVPGVVLLNGPAFLELGTDSNSVPLQLGPVTVNTAVIAGTQSVNLYLSTFLENPDDGKVSVASARVEGMCAMLTLKVSHPFIMKNKESMQQTLSYLKSGRFTLPHAEYPDCAFPR